MKDLYVAKTFAGLEEVLAQELRDLNLSDITILNRAVSFTGDLKDLYTANYWCRTTLRILKPIAEFPAADDNELYKGIRSIDWSLYMDLDGTFAVDSTLSNSKINHSQYAALKTKDAIADQFVFKFGKRPDVDTDRPTLRVSIFIQNDLCTVSLDSSSISLHKRGYRKTAGMAPLNEALAAGMILLSGWDKKSPFVDPMCGSGTLLIEAAMIAMNIPPANFRDYFGFLTWKDFDKEIWEEVKRSSLDLQVDFESDLIGTDLSAGMIAVAEKNIRAAHLQHDIKLYQMDMHDFNPPEGPGMMICNPPYGERIKTRDIVDLYREMGDTLKQKYEGYSAWIISSDIIALKQIGLAASRKLELYNGALECRYERFDIYEGSKKAKNIEIKDKYGDKKSTEPAYRKKEDWDKDGHQTKFKGRTKTEWEIENKGKKSFKESEETSKEKKYERTDSKAPRRSFKDDKKWVPREDFKKTDGDKKKWTPREDFKKTDGDKK
ncbi:MAG: RNA methyltransferase, partial [Bacteroidales bacterium]|nr:RNA methyltransferase [Bacteroidales bacterium]